MRKTLVAALLLASVLLIAAVVSGCGDSNPFSPTTSSQFAFIRESQSGTNQPQSLTSMPRVTLAATESGIVPGPYDVYTMSNNGAQGSEKKLNQESAAIYGVQLSRDGKKAVYTALTCCVDGGAYLQVFVADMANPNNPVQLTTDATGHVLAEISPDGKKVVYITTGNLEAYVVSSSGNSGQPTEVAVPGGAKIYRATFTPSNQLVVVADTVAGGRGIYIVNLNGSGLKQLTTNASDTSPSVSADGTKIAFQRYIDGLWNIWIMDSNGWNAEQLPTNGQSYDPLFVNDKIVFTGHLDNDNDLDIYSMNFDGASPTELTHTVENDFFDFLGFYI